MTTYTITGPDNKTYSIDGPPGATQEQVIAQIQAAKASAPQPAPPPTNTYADIFKSAATGLGKGVAAIAGLPGDVGDLEKRGIQYVGNKLSPGMGDRAKGGLDAISVVPDSDKINSGIQSVTGQYHQPQTTAGNYAQTIASFVPAAVGGEGSLALRAAKTVIPAVASEGAGEIAQDSGLSPGWQTAARIAGAGIGAAVGNPAVGGAIRSINAVSAGKFGVSLLDPMETAATKMRAAVNSDGGPSAVGSNIVDWRASGASGPALVDVGGNNVRRLVRAAAGGGTGQAQNIATDYADKVSANFQPQVLAHTRGLTPGATNSATNYSDLLQSLQKDDAEYNYKAPYAEPASVTPDMVSALQGPEGRGAIGRAFAAARANRDVQQMGELQDLKDVASEQGGGQDPITGQRRTVGQALTGLSAGSLDRVRIAMRETGRALSAKGANDIAGGYFDRVKDIDSALDQTPGLKDARASYADYARQQDAVDLGRTGLNAGASDYAASIANLAKNGRTPQLDQALGVGHRQALVDKLSAQSAGFTSAAKNIATSDQDTSNIATTFGSDRGAKYQSAVGNETKRVGNANFIIPGSGSQSEPRFQDTASLLSSVPHSLPSLAMRVWDTVRGHGAPLTEPERAAIVRLGTTEANLRQLVQRNPGISRAAIAQIAAGNNSQRN